MRLTKKFTAVVTLVSCLSGMAFGAGPVPVQNIRFSDINTQISILKKGEADEAFILEILSSRLGNDVIGLSDETKKQETIWYELKPEFDRHVEMSNDFPSLIDIPINGLPGILENSVYYEIKEGRNQNGVGLEIDKAAKNRLFSMDWPLSVSLDEGLIEIIDHCRNMACTQLMGIKRSFIPDEDGFLIALNDIQEERLSGRKSRYVLMATVEVIGLVKTRRIPSIMGHFIDSRIVNLRLLKKE